MDDDEQFDLGPKPDDVDEENRLSVYHQAQEIVGAGRIKFDIEISKFIASSSSGRSFLVAMHPWRCSCPGTTTCSHLIAAHMVTGFTDKKAKRPPNAALAANKARKAADKTGGRKKPRQKDLDQKVKKEVGEEALKVNKTEDDESLNTPVIAFSNKDSIEPEAQELLGGMEIR